MHDVRCSGYHIARRAYVTPLVTLHRPQERNGSVRRHHGSDCEQLRAEGSGGAIVGWLGVGIVPLSLHRMLDRLL